MGLTKDFFRGLNPQLEAEPMDNEQTITFAMHLTGHDREIIEQMFNDWDK